jgi:hypothetical protein
MTTDTALTRQQAENVKKPEASPIVDSLHHSEASLHIRYVFLHIAGKVSLRA